MKFTVYEYTKNAGSYEGTRFMTSYVENTSVNDKMTIIAENIDEDEANRLVRETRSKNIDAYLNSLPEFLRNNEKTDFFIRNILEEE